MTDDSAWLDHLRQKFVQRLASEGAAFRALMGDRGSVIDRAHKLAGIAGMLGAPEVGAAALALEEAALAGGQYDAEMAALLASIEAART